MRRIGKKVTAAATDYDHPARRQCVPPRRSRRSPDGDTRLAPHFQIELSNWTGWIRCACCCEWLPGAQPVGGSPREGLSAQQLARKIKETVGISVPNRRWAMFETAFTRSEGKSRAHHSDNAPKASRRSAASNPSGAHANHAVDLDL